MHTSYTHYPYYCYLPGAASLMHTSFIRGRPKGSLLDGGQGGGAPLEGGTE